MSHFYGKIPGVCCSRKTDATARGTKKTGITTQAASWAGAIETTLWYDEKTELDMYEVRMISWKGRGESRVIERGIVGRGPVEAQAA